MRLLCKYLTPFVATVSLSCAACLAQESGMPTPQPLTVEDAIRVALENHNQIGIARSQEDAAEARVTQSRSSYYPQITPSYRYSNQRSAYDFGNGTETDSLTQNITAIGLEQLLFDTGRREQNLARSKDSAKAAAYNTEATRQAVILNVTNAWYEVRRSQDLVRVAESGAERARTTLEATRAFVEAGSSPRKDVLQAQAEYENAQVQVIQARNGVRLAKTDLRYAMGVKPLSPITVSDEPVPDPPTGTENRPVADLVEQAYADRPDLKGSEADLSANRRNVKIARIDAGPQILSTLGAGYRANPNPGNESTILATLTYPLFDAGSARAGVRAARASLRQSEQALELSRQNVAAEVESAYLQRDEALTRIDAARTALAAAQENYNAATESQKEGVGTILDVITAQNQLVTAETNAVQAVYDFYTADARLRRAIGDNDPYISGGNP